MPRALAFTLGLLLAGCQFIPAPTVIPFADGKNWRLAEPLPYRLGDTEHVIEVPQGFVTDFASVPQIAWSVMSPTDRYGRAGIVHDFLYWDQGCTQEEADKIMLLGMIETDVNGVQRTLIYAALRIGGEPAWKDNATKRREGWPREIPDEYPVPPDAVWPRFSQVSI